MKSVTILADSLPRSGHFSRKNEDDAVFVGALIVIVQADKNFRGQ